MSILLDQVVRPTTTETTALGVAFLAGLATGFWKDISDLKKLWIEDMSFHPDTSFKSNTIIELWENRINRLLKVNE